MTNLSRLAWLTLVTVAAGVPVATDAQDHEPQLARQHALSAARQAREAERARVARLRWESERRRSAAHACMPDTMYASTPSAPAVELSCPVVTDDNVQRALQGFTTADDLARSPLLSQDWLRSGDGDVFRSP